MANNTIHIYGQYMWHDPCYIVGTRESLLALQKTIDLALQQGSAEYFACVNDAEGYDIIVKVDECVKQDGYSVPYTTDCAAEKRKNAFFPWSKKKEDSK